MAKKEKEVETTVVEVTEPTKQTDKVETSHPDVVELKVSSLKTDVVLSSELSELKKELADLKKENDFLRKVKNDYVSEKIKLMMSVSLGIQVEYNKKLYEIVNIDTVKEMVDHSRKRHVNEDDFAVVLRELK